MSATSGPHPQPPNLLAAAAVSTSRAVSQLVVAMVGTQGLAAVVSTVLGWLGRGHEAPRTVRLELGGDILELSAASSEEQDRLVAIFLSKHAEKD